MSHDSLTKDLRARTGRGLKPIGQNASAADAQTRGLKTGVQKIEWRHFWLTNRFGQWQLTTCLIGEVSKICDGRSQAAFWSPRPHRTVSHINWLEYLCTNATLVVEVNTLRKLLATQNIFPIAYCIDTVVDTQVQQVATAQTVRKSKVAAPVVLFYFLFLSTRKGKSPCRYIL